MRIWTKWTEKKSYSLVVCWAHSNAAHRSVNENNELKANANKISITREQKHICIVAYVLLECHVTLHQPLRMPAYEVKL